MIVYDDGVYQIKENRWKFHNVDEIHYVLSGGDIEDPVSCDSLEEAKELIEFIEEGVTVPGKMIHLARMDLGDEPVLDPEYSNQDIYYGGPKGVSFAPSAKSAARGLPEDDRYYGESIEYAVYTPVERKKIVFDPEGTGDPEFRVIEPIKARRVGLISLIVDPGEPMRLKWLEKE